MSDYSCRRCGSTKHLKKMGGAVCSVCRTFVPFRADWCENATFELVEGGTPFTNTKGLDLIDKSLKRRQND